MPTACSGDSAVGGSAIMEAHTQFGAATAMHLLYQRASRLCAHSSSISANKKMFHGPRGSQ